MPQKSNARKMDPQTQTLPPRNDSETRPLEIVDLLGRVSNLFRDEQVTTALDTIVRSGIKSPWTSNALGVCQLRLGNAKVAMDVFRALVLASGGLALRRDVPTVFKTNYVTALLLSGNLSGGQSLLREIGDDLNPAVVKLQQAIRRWEQGLTFWQRLNWWMGGQPDHPFALGFPPGDLE